VKRRTRKQWYEYHLAKAQEEARDVVAAVYLQEIESIRATQRKAWNALTTARECEPVKSRLLALIGTESQYRRQILAPLQSDLALRIERCQMHLSVIRNGLTKLRVTEPRTIVKRGS